ncbi:MAG: rod shape-determining protein MreD [Nitrospinae bacterium RIFCSPLOWO2_12_FULL_45_22]|nr:MAG: rod shape-determining protein MreD [Nitrospinae bacterium RIFCSPLOWO2_12_FULL_45_22]
MKFVFTAFIIFLIPIFQYTFLPFLSFQHLTPDLFLIMTIYFSIIMRSYDKGYLYGLGLGLLQDLIGGGIAGVNTLSKGLLSLLSKIISSRFLRVHSITQLLFFLLGSLIDSALLLVTTSSLLEKSLTLHIFLSTMFIKFALNTLLGIPLISYLLKLEEAVKTRKRPVYYVRS